MLILAAALALTLAQRGTQQQLLAPPDVAAPPADATKTASGLATKVLTPGTGKDHPSRDDIVIIHYTGWTTTGRMFDSSVARGTPQPYPVTRFIPGMKRVTGYGCGVPRATELSNIRPVVVHPV